MSLFIYSYDYCLVLIHVKYHWLNVFCFFLVFRIVKNSGRTQLVIRVSNNRLTLV